MMFSDLTSVYQVSSFTSCIKNYGRPILPPLLSVDQRHEMAEIRHQAIIAETRITRRNLQKSSLMDKVQAIMHRIERSQSNLNAKESIEDCLNEPAEIDGLKNALKLKYDISKLSDSVSVLNHENQQQSNLNENQKNTRDPVLQQELQAIVLSKDSSAQCNNLESSMSNAEFDAIESNSWYSHNNSKSHSETKSAMPDLCLSTNETIYGSEVFNSQYNPVATFNFKNSTEDFEPFSYIATPLNDASSANVASYSEAGESSPELKSSETGEMECLSLATVILNTCNGLQNETDTDSVVTSIAQSTDLEKYLDSSADNGRLSEVSLGIENNKGAAFTFSASSDYQRSETDTDNELTPLASPCTLQNTPVTSDTLHSETVHVFFKDGGEKQNNTPRKHVRSASYTLDQPSPALIQAHSGCSCETSPDSDKILPHSALHSGNFSILTYSPNPTESKNIPCESNILDCGDTDHAPALKKMKGTSNLIFEAGDHVFDKEQYIPTSLNYLLDSFNKSCNNNLPTSSTSLVSKVRQEILQHHFHIENVSQDLEIPANTQAAIKQVPYNYIRSDDREVEDDRKSCDRADCIDINRLLHHQQLIKLKNGLSVSEEQEEMKQKSKPLDDLYNLQEAHKQRVQNFMVEQKKQWEKLQEEFKEQEKQLCEQLENLGLPVSSGLSCDDETKKKSEYIPSLQAANKNVDEMKFEKNPVLQNSSAFVIPNIVIDFLPHSNRKVTKVVAKGSSKQPNLNEVVDSVMKKKFDRVSAVVKGYLTRKLLKTEHVQRIIKTIKDTLECAVRFHQETPIKKGFITEQDAKLHQRFISQLNAACYELHDVFFKLSAKERMMIISQSREKSKEKKSNVIFAPEIAHISPFPMVNGKPKLSSATVKVLERKKARSALGNKRDLADSTLKKSPGRIFTKGTERRSYSAVESRSYILSPSAKAKNGRTITPFRKSENSSKGVSKPSKNVRRSLYAKKETNAAHIALREPLLT